ncbi:MAG: hypothetical protein K6L81_06220 [Agarilytica sp.]
MNKAIFAVLITFCSMNSFATVNCRGVIEQVYKWDHFESISIRIKLITGQFANWISMPTKSDESMALMAFASGNEVLVHMSESSVTECVEGWSHNKKLKGYFLIEKS